jgi:hypothetical protein
MFYGNCHSEFMRDVLRTDPNTADLYHYVYIPSYAQVGEPEPPPTQEDFEKCEILCEQVDWKMFPHRNRLPPGCKTVRFPPLDSMLLWPFTCPNPYNRPDPPEFPYGRFVAGDRIILREIDRGAQGEEVLEYYLTKWDDYKLDLDRLEKLESVRLKKRDDASDVLAGDLVIDRMTREQLFWNFGHPKLSLIVALMERVVEYCSRYEPALRSVDIQRVVRDSPQVNRNFGVVEVPVHPRIAEALNLEWYDPGARYLQYGGFRYSYKEYFEEYIRYCISNKRNAALGNGTSAIYGSDWLPPILGPGVSSDAIGYFPDGFIGKRLAFRLIASKPISGLRIEGFCPAQHLSALHLDLKIDGENAATLDVQPGNEFAIESPRSIAAGETVIVELASSEVMNLLERGESEDARDLSVLLLSIECR